MWKERGEVSEVVFFGEKIGNSKSTNPQKDISVEKKWLSKGVPSLLGILVTSSAVLTILDQVWALSRRLSTINLDLSSSQGKFSAMSGFFLEYSQFWHATSNKMEHKRKGTIFWHSSICPYSGVVRFVSSVSSRILSDGFFLNKQSEPNDPHHEIG